MVRSSRVLSKGEPSEDNSAVASTEAKRVAYDVPGRSCEAGTVRYKVHWWELWIAFAIEAVWWKSVKGIGEGHPAEGELRCAAGAEHVADERFGRATRCMFREDCSHCTRFHRVVVRRAGPVKIHIVDILRRYARIP